MRIGGKNTKLVGKNSLSPKQLIFTLSAVCLFRIFAPLSKLIEYGL